MRLPARVSRGSIQQRGLVPSLVGVQRGNAPWQGCLFGRCAVRQTHTLSNRTFHQFQLQLNSRITGAASCFIFRQRNDSGRGTPERFSTRLCREKHGRGGMELDAQGPAAFRRKRERSFSFPRRARALTERSGCGEPSRSKRKRERKIVFLYKIALDFVLEPRRPPLAPCRLTREPSRLTKGTRLKARPGYAS